MKFFPESALVQLEFDKVKALLVAHARTDIAKLKAESLRIHTKLEFIELELRQTSELKSLLQNGQFFPNDFVSNVSKELKLLSIPGAVLTGEQFLLLGKLAENVENIFRWFDPEKRTAYPALLKVISDTYYEKAITGMVGAVLDDNGSVRDRASEQLAEIRTKLFRKRNDLRRMFDRILSKLQRSGYVADIEESFLNGRRVVAVHAEHKRQIKGILHGESDTRKTSFIEPDETVSLNNDIFSLENDEKREVYRILRDLTAKISIYFSLLDTYYHIAGEYDFINAKARLGIEMQGSYPVVRDQAQVHLIKAYHPLLYVYNQRNKKQTIPTDIALDEKYRILVISGPNAGGKTVTLKTVGLLQLMIQSGLLVPVDPNSEFGIFKQILIDIGDTQSLEFELSTYSSHLLNMKHFMENASGRTLFFIDELGSGSDPNLGGAFAEVILEELVRKHAFGIVTTHYLNLKVMAGKTPGIINGAMSFDEKNLQPLYRLMIGKPGSSYTFSIAKRIGLDQRLVSRARSLIDEDHFRLDKLLNRTEQDLRNLQEKEKELHKLLKENEKLKKEMEALVQKEQHLQRIELLKHQNKISEDRIDYLKEMERKLKQIIFDWRKTENKNDVIKQMQGLLFKQKEKTVNEKVRKKFDAVFEEIGGEVKPGDKVMMKKNHQVGTVKEIRNKNAVIQIGLMPMTVSLGDITLIRDKKIENVDPD
jgi:DNA mismatch repair protein MutS2